jgi:hypothetical protein
VVTNGPIEVRFYLLVSLCLRDREFGVWCTWGTGGDIARVRPGPILPFQAESVEDRVSARVGIRRHTAAVPSQGGKRLNFRARGARPFPNTRQTQLVDREMKHVQKMATPTGLGGGWIGDAAELEQL